MNRPEWVESDLACVLNHFPSVGLMSNWPKDELIHALRLSRARAAIVSHEIAESIARVA